MAALGIIWHLKDFCRTRSGKALAPNQQLKARRNLHVQRAFDCLSLIQAQVRMHVAHFR